MTKTPGITVKRNQGEQSRLADEAVGAMTVRTTEPYQSKKLKDSLRMCISHWEAGYIGARFNLYIL